MSGVRILSRTSIRSSGNVDLSMFPLFSYKCVLGNINVFEIPGVHDCWKGDKRWQNKEDRNI